MRFQEYTEKNLRWIENNPKRRVLYRKETKIFPNDPCSGENPPYGACIHYYLKTEPKGDVVIAILDENGQTMRTLKTEKTEDLELDNFSRQHTKPFKVPKNAGINRIWWDLRHDRTKLIKLRTPPLGHDHVRVGPRGWRPFPRGSRSRGPLVPPGVYTVKLTVGDRKVTQKLVVKKDPHSSGTEADIQAQTKIMLDIHRKMDSVADLINQVELIRKQIDDLEDLLNETEKMQPVIKAADALEKKLIDIESFFFTLEVTGSGDGLRWPDKFYVKLRFLANDIGKSDFPPTCQQLKVHEMFTKQLAEYEGRFHDLVAHDVSAFNSLLEENGILNIITDRD